MQPVPTMIKDPRLHAQPRVGKELHRTRLTGCSSYGSLPGSLRARDLGTLGEETLPRLSRPKNSQDEREAKADNARRRRENGRSL
jgi:hypothetical protein